MRDEKAFEFSVKWLAAEVLQLALKDLADVKKITVHNTARLWLKDESYSPFGFRWCLSQCEINPNYIRGMIKEIEAGKKFFEIKRRLKR
ncbi:MAG: hypothetical protein ABIJ40_07270 [Bacteroidota bacterium]